MNRYSILDSGYSILDAEYLTHRASLYPASRIKHRESADLALGFYLKPCLN